ncbi:hypothetical protein DITRI_Ditri01bG0173900 [Diplodiscus trichospermus]
MNSKLTTLPGILFTCRTLVTLILNIDFILNVPNYVCFPNLKTLHLIWVQFFNDDSVKRLFSSCICLEDMIIEQCELDNISNFNISNHSLKRLTIVYPECYSDFTNYWIEIDAPMLVYFNYANSQAAGYSLKNLHSLATADIDLLLTDNSSTYKVASTFFFRGICNVQSLNFSLTSMELLSSCEPVPDFPNMVQLNIFDDYPLSFIQWEGKGLETLLGVTPELEKLTFCQEVFNENYLPEKVPSCFLFKLKEIEISKFEAEKDCMVKAKYFLANAGVLEKLTIHTRYEREKEKQTILEELLASPRKSKQCCIIIV